MYNFKFFKAIFKINGVTYNSDDFNKIADIIMLQNEIEHIDDTIQKEVREEIIRYIFEEERKNQKKKKDS